jgi:Uncharacterised nucleotidyltransferase
MIGQLEGKSGVLDLARRGSSPMEPELVWACCRESPGSGSDRTVARLITPELQWNILSNFADVHGVAPLVYRYLCSSTEVVIPATFLQEVRMAMRCFAARSILMAMELVRVIRLLEAVNVTAIPYKGPVLAQYLYGDMTLRECSDLDLIVKEQDVRQAKESLVEAGYHPAFPFSRSQETAYLRWSCVYELQNSDKRVAIELHWRTRTHPSLALPPDLVWTGLRETLFLGASIKTLSPEALLLLLCAHGTKHKWRQLRSVCDIADLVRAAPELDWDKVLKTANHLGSRRMILIAVCLAHELMKPPVPASVLQEIERDPQIKTITAQLFTSILRGSSEPDDYWSLCRFNLLAYDHWLARLSYLAKVALTPTVEDFASTPLPPCLSPAYPLLRVFRLLKAAVSN